MATPGQMVQTMADVLGIPAATVSQYDRQLAEAGLRTTGGRGPSAAKVGATDAANLLIAILGSLFPAPQFERPSKSAKRLDRSWFAQSFPTLRNFGDMGFTLWSRYRKPTPSEK